MRDQLDYVQIPKKIKEQNKMVMLTANIIFVNQIPFIIMYRWGVRLITVEWIPNRTTKQLAINSTKVLQLYTYAGLIIQTILMDMEFGKVQDLLPQVNINIGATNEHVAEVERRIRTAKERCTGIMVTLSFSHLPQQLIINLVQFATMWLNAFSNRAGVSNGWSLKELIYWHKLDADKSLKCLLEHIVKFMMSLI